MSGQLPRLSGRAAVKAFGRDGWQIAPVFVQADETDGKITAGLVAVGSHGLTPPF